MIHLLRCLLCMVKRLLLESDSLSLHYYSRLFYSIKLAANDSHSELDRPDVLSCLSQQHEQDLEYGRVLSLAQRNSMVSE